MSDGNRTFEILKQWIYILSLVSITAFIWVQVYRAGLLPYDENFEVLILVFLLSVTVLVTGIIFLIRKTKLIQQNLLLTALFLIVNSPLTIVFVVMQYEFIFGIHLDVG